ncbi:MAG: hypothetical protein ACREID_02760 [Planctomycetota bacterium]
MAGAEVRADWSEDSRARGVFDGEPPSARTDAEGRFSIRVPEGAKTALLARHPAHGVSAETGATTGGEPVRLQLLPPMPLAGRVVDTRGAPLAGTLVALHGAGGPRFAAGIRVTDELGRFEIENAPAADLVLRFDHPEYERASLAVARGPGRELPAVALARGRAISGLVVDAAGRALAGVAVVARLDAASPGDDGRAMARSVSDGDGRFLLSGLAQGEYLLRLSDRAWHADPVRAAAGRGESRLVAEAASSVHGRVLAGGEPVAGARVRALPDGIGEQTIREPVAEATTGPDGAFLLAPLAPDRPLVIAARHDELGEARISLTPTDDPVDLRLERPSR